MRRPSPVVVLLLLAAPVLAQEIPVDNGPFHSWEPFPVGGRTATMGGAGVAAGGDSAMPLLNPAGLAQVDRHRITMSASAYMLHAIDVQHPYTTGERPEEWDDQQIHGPIDELRTQTTDAFPSSFVYSWPLGAPAGESGHHVLSLSVLVPRREYNEWVGRFGLEVAGARTEQSFTLAESITSYHLGPTYSVQVGDSVRLGLGLQALYQPTFSAFSSTGRDFIGAEHQSFTGTAVGEGWSLDAMAVLGIQVETVRGLWLGASFSSPSLHLAGAFERHTNTATSASPGLVLDEVSDGNQLTSSSLKADDYRLDVPFQVAAGIAFERPRSFAIAVDVRHFGELLADRIAADETTHIHGEDGAERTEVVRYQQRTQANALLNVNAGLEVFVTDEVALRFGGFVDTTSAVPLEDRRDESRMLDRDISQYGGTAGLGISVGPADFTLGVVYAAGTGKVGAFRNLLTGEPEYMAAETSTPPSPGSKGAPRTNWSRAAGPTGSPPPSPTSGWGTRRTTSSSGTPRSSRVRPTSPPRPWLLQPRASTGCARGCGLRETPSRSPYRRTLRRSPCSSRWGWSPTRRSARRWPPSVPTRPWRRAPSERRRRSSHESWPGVRRSSRRPPNACAARGETRSWASWRRSGRCFAARAGWGRSSAACGPARTRSRRPRSPRRRPPRGRTRRRQRRGELRCAGTPPRSPMRSFFLFGYGSLLYAPELPEAVLRLVPARLDGYRRAFNKLSRSRLCAVAESYDAFPDVPGVFVDGDRYRSLVLGTEVSAGACIEGMLLEYPEERRAEVLAVTDRREAYDPKRPSRRNGYLRRPVDVVRTDTRAALSCETWLTNTDPAQRYRAPEMDLAAQAKVLVNATPRRAWRETDGGLPYLEGTRDALRGVGIVDPDLESLADQVRALPGPWVERVRPRSSRGRRRRCGERRTRR